jgi:O-methyltransferase involved in polyketide biosynthesis
VEAKYIFDQDQQDDIFEDNLAEIFITTTGDFFAFLKG